MHGTARRAADLQPVGGGGGDPGDPGGDRRGEPGPNVSGRRERHADAAPRRGAPGVHRPSPAGVVSGPAQRQRPRAVSSGRRLPPRVGGRGAIAGGGPRVRAPDALGAQGSSRDLQRRDRAARDPDGGRGDDRRGRRAGGRHRRRSRGRLEPAALAHGAPGPAGAGDRGTVPAHHRAQRRPRTASPSRCTTSATRSHPASRSCACSPSSATRPRSSPRPTRGRCG